MRSAWLLFLFGIHHVLCANLRVDPLVQIDQGLVRGEKSKDGAYSSFLGIPYAQVDPNNPFGPALSAPKFDGTFLAYDDSIKCPQVSDSDAEGSLDCLRLNVYVPSEASVRNPLPVIVWIHGGYFEKGSGSYVEPAGLLSQGIIVVAINYRLGPYGFMCLNIPEVPGNQGLKDQYAALQWVRNNINAFGGNPYQVTIGGEDAGSASVLYHLYSSYDKLYTKVIVESGTPQNEGMFVDKDTEAAVKLAKQLGLETTSTSRALAFLKDSSPSLVMAASRELNLKLKPCRETSYEGLNRIIDNDPPSLSNPRKVRTTSVLIGHTAKEHKGQLLELYGKQYLNQNPFYEKLQNNFNLDDKVLTSVANIIKHFYVGDEGISSDILPVLENFESDFVVNHPVQRTVTNLLSDDAPAVYQYLFSYGENSDSTRATSNEVKIQDDKLIARRITVLWSNFVKYGNPTPQETSLLPVTWTPSSLNARPYLVLDTNLRIESRVYHDRMAFWDLFYAVFEERSRFAVTK